MRSLLSPSLVFLLFAGTLLPAVESSAHEDEQIDEIVVNGRWDRPNGLTVSASQGFVSQREIDVRPRLRPGDVLEVVPGLIVTQHSGSGKSNQMFLRGFNLDHGTDFATWIDGMPINMPTHGHGQGYTDLNFIIPELIDSLEFRKGPYYADVSDFSSAGAAYFSTPRTIDSAIVKAGVGKDGFGQLLYANSYSGERGDLLVGLQANRYDGPWVGVGEDLGKYNAIARYTESTPGISEWNVMFMGYDASWNSADQVPLRAVKAGLVSRLGTIDDTVGGSTSRYSLSARWHRDLGEHQVTLRGYGINYELDLYSNFTYFLDDPVRGDQFKQVDDRRVYGGNLDWRYTPSESVAHHMGLALRIDDIDTVGLLATEQRAFVDVVRLDEVRQFSTGAFYEIENIWNERWRSSLGIRADYYSFDVRNSNIAENAGDASDWLVSPKLNIIRTLTNEAEMYFSAGYGFHSNDARGTVIKTDPTTGEPATSVDPLVESRGAELGMRYFDEQRWNVSASLWLLELDSELLFVGDAGNTEPSRASRRYGIEVPAYYRMNDTWMFDLEVALTRSKFTGAGDEGDAVPGSVDRVVAAGVAAEFDNGFYGTLRLRHFGERPLTEDGRIKSGSSTVWNLGLGYRFPRFDLRLEVLNLFDSDSDDITYYYESRLPGELSSGIADVHFHPIEPRTYRAYIAWTGAD